jgi:hypothetical protein
MRKWPIVNAILIKNIDLVRFTNMTCGMYMLILHLSDYNLSEWEKSDKAFESIITSCK